MAFEIHKYVAMVTQWQINYQILLEESCFNNVEPRGRVEVGVFQSSQHTVEASEPKCWENAAATTSVLDQNAGAPGLSPASRNGVSFLKKKWLNYGELS